MEMGFVSQVRAPVVAPVSLPASALAPVGFPDDFIEDPYCFEEGVNLVQTDPHARELSALRLRFEAYEAAYDLGFRVTSDLQVHHIPNEVLDGTPYRQTAEGGKLAFDIALWNVARDTDPTATSLRWGAWGRLLFVLEVVSAQSRQADLIHKRTVCERLRVHEYWVLDPQDPDNPLRGWHLDIAGRKFQPVKEARDGWPSHVLHSVLRTRRGSLDWWDDTLGDWFSIELQNHRRGQADLLAELVSRHTDAQCGTEFRDRLLRIPVAQWPDIEDVIRVVTQMDDRRERRQAIRDMLAP